MRKKTYHFQTNGHSFEIHCGPETNEEEAKRLFFSCYNLLVSVTSGGGVRVDWQKYMHNVDGPPDALAVHNAILKGLGVISTSADRHWQVLDEHREHNFTPTEDGPGSHVFFVEKWHAMDFADAYKKHHFSGVDMRFKIQNVQQEIIVG